MICECNGVNQSKYEHLQFHFGTHWVQVRARKRLSFHISISDTNFLEILYFWETLLSQFSETALNLVRLILVLCNDVIYGAVSSWIRLSTLCPVLEKVSWIKFHRNTPTPSPPCAILAFSTWDYLYRHWCQCWYPLDQLLSGRRFH